MSDLVNDEVEQAFREGFKAGSEQAETYKDLLRETLPILRAAFFANHVQSKNADELYDRIRRAVGE
jgi:hypothetical protein